MSRLEDNKQIGRNYCIGVHFFYIVLILISLIIFLATKNWTKIEGFTEFLGVAATITSLVLGILAIIYSFVSNGAMSQSLGSIDSSTASIQNVSVELRAAAQGTEKIQERAEERISQLHSIVSELKQVITSIHDRTANIEGKIESMPEALVKMRSPTTEKPDDSTAQITWTKAQIHEFLSNISQIGMVALYALLTAEKDVKYCDLKLLFNENEYNNFNYVYGFLIATEASQLIKIESQKKNEEISKPSRLSSSDNFKDVFYEVWNSDFSDSTSEMVQQISSRVSACLVD